MMFAIKASDITVLPEEYSTIVCVAGVIRPSSFPRRTMLSARYPDVSTQSEELVLFQWNHLEEP